MHFPCLEFPARGGAQPHSPLLRFCTQKVVRPHPPPLLESNVRQMRFCCLHGLAQGCQVLRALCCGAPPALARNLSPLNFARSLCGNRPRFSPSAPFRSSQGLRNAVLQRAARTTGSCVRPLCNASSPKTFPAGGCSAHSKKKAKQSMQTARLSRKAAASHLNACFAVLNLQRDRDVNLVPQLLRTTGSPFQSESGLR
jgi:hypothetical protein